MKKLLALLFCAASLYANDAAYVMSAGTLMNYAENDLQIQMAAEVITMTLYDDYYEVNVAFDFFNHGNDKTILVGFPFFDSGLDSAGIGAIQNFKAFTNGIPVELNEFTLTSNGMYVNKSGYKTGFAFAYTRNVFFPGGKTTKTSVSYRSTYGRYPLPTIHMASYYYGSGNCWYDVIENIRVHIENKSRNFISWIETGDKIREDKVTWLTGDKFELHLKNIKPENDDMLLINIVRPYYDNMADFDVEPYNLDKQVLLEKNLRYITGPQLRRLRNALYAHNGYIFRDEGLNQLFGDVSWYSPVSDAEPQLNETEKRNLQIIQNIEKQRPY